MSYFPSPPSAMENGPSLPGAPPIIPLTFDLKSIHPSIFSELANSIKGTVHTRGDSSFELHSKLFNGDVICRATLLVRPLDTEDVSQTIKFCSRHSLSLSVKAGGYGTHGQAAQGNVIVDISLLNDISFEKINAEGGFTSIRDMLSSKTVGKCSEPKDELLPEGSKYGLLPPQSFFSHLSGKRRAEEAFGTDATKGTGLQPLAHEFSTSSASGSDLSSFQRGGPFPKVRRTDGTSSEDTLSNIASHVSTKDANKPLERQKSSGSNSGDDGASGSGSSSRSSQSDSGSMPSVLGAKSISTSVTSIESGISKSPPSQSDPFGYMSSSSMSLDPLTSKSSSHADPFGYMSDSPPSATYEPPTLLMQPSSHPPGLISAQSLSSTEYYMPTRVNTIYPHAYFTFGAGAMQKDVDIYSASHPLPATSIEGTPCFTPYHIPFSAHPVGASVMLLGGFGFLSRLHGLSIDNLVEAEVVLADGSIVIVSETENTDLWWAIRGAGPAFGIVTRYKAKAYPIPVVFAGNLIYKFRRSTAASLIKHFRDCVKNVPRELYANVILTAGPDGDALVVIQLCYLGTQDQGVEFLQAITSWDGEQCLLNEVSEKSFLYQQDSLAQLINGKAGRKWFIRSDLLSTLSDEVIHETVVRFADTPVGCTWLFELSGGNVSDEHGGCFPASVRQATWTVAAFHQWELDEDDPRCVTSAENWIRDTLGPASTGGPFPSFFGIHESCERIKGSFGDNWNRLCEIKRKYDPHGFFKHNFWPLDKDGQAITSCVPTHTEF